MESSDTLVNLMNTAASLSEAVIVFALMLSVVYILLGSKCINEAIKVHSQYGFRLGVLTIVTSPFLFIPLAFFICSVSAIRKRRAQLAKARRRELAKAQREGGRIILPGRSTAEIAKAKAKAAAQKTIRKKKLLTASKRKRDSSAVPQHKKSTSFSIYESRAKAEKQAPTTDKADRKRPAVQNGTYNRDGADRASDNSQEASTAAV